MLGRADTAERVLADLAGLKRGTLSIQASQTIASYWLPRHLVDFRRAHPGIDIKLTVGNTADVAAAVLSGAVELGFIEGPIDMPALTSREVGRDNLLILVGPGHPWANATGLTPKDLETAEWVMREPESGTRVILEDALTARGVQIANLEITLELPTNEAVRAAVESGMSVTALSASVAVSSLEAGLLSQVAVDLPERVFSAIHHQERHLSNAACALLDAISTGR